MPHGYGQSDRDSRDHQYPVYGSYYSAHQSPMEPEPKDCTNCTTLEQAYNLRANELKALKQRLSQPCNGCVSLRTALDTLDRKRHLENERASSRHRKELAESLSCAREEFQKQHESVVERARKECQRTYQEKEQLCVRLFTACKAAKRFAEAESIYYDIMRPLPPRDRGAKSDLMYEFAEMMMEQGNYEQAEMVAREAFNHRESRVKTEGQGSMESRLSFRQLASALCHQESPVKQKQAIEMHRQIWENDAPHDWKAENGDLLCQIYAVQKQYHHAQQIQYEVWEERRRKSGIRNEDTMNSALQRIAMLDGAISALDKEHRCHDEKDVEKEFWEKKIRDFITEIWNSGKEMAETDARVHDIGHRLGESHYQRKEYTKAGDIFKQVWEGRKKSLGDKNIKTLECGHRLGEIYWKQKDYVNAGDVFEQVWQGKKESLGDNEPETLECGHRLGEIHYHQKKYDKAKDVFGQVWNKRSSSPGDKNLDILASGHRLGEIHLMRKEYAKAETVFHQVWNGRNSTLGENNSETVESAHQLAKSIYAQADSDEGKFAKGILFLKGLWEARKPVLENPSPTMVSNSSFLAAFDNGFMYGSLLVKSGNIPDAEKVLQPLWELKIGPEVDALQLRVGHFWGICLARQNQYAKAREVFESVLHRRSAMPGLYPENCLDTAKELKNVCDLEKVKEKGRKKRLKREWSR